MLGCGGEGHKDESMKPFLSVITINKNNAAGLRGTIKSVLSQDGIKAEDLEYIIIDGGSSDGSVEVIKEYAARTDLPHKISYWVSEKDDGIYCAMNRGIKAAHGQYIAILNSGDIYVKDALRGIKEEALSHKGDVLYGAIDCTKGGVFLRVSGRSMVELPHRMIAHPATFVPRKVYDEVGMYDESFKIFGDWDLFARFSEQKVRFSHVPKIITVFDTCGISSVKDRKWRHERNKLLNKHFGKGAALYYCIKRIARLLCPYGLWLIMGACKRQIKAKIKERKAK